MDTSHIHPASHSSPTCRRGSGVCVYVVDVFSLHSRLSNGSLHGKDGPPPIHRRLGDVMRVS